MSYYATVDDADQGDIATSSGWHDFAKFVATLEGVDELRNLTDYGWADDGNRLASDLQGAIDTGIMSDDQTDIAKELLAIAKNMELDAVLTISDGVGVVE